MVFIYFTCFGFKNVKKSTFLLKNIYCAFFFIKLMCGCLRTDPGDLKTAKQMKFDIQQTFYA